MTFSQQLCRLRRERGLSQEKLGEAVGVSRQTISKWELGETTPELEKLHLLCDYFQISMDELTGRSLEPSTEPAGAQMVQEPFQKARWRLGGGYVYEHKSRRTLWGLPLVHINLGPGLRKARGIVAVGNVAQGVLAFGGISLGVVSVGGISVGALTLAGLGAGLLVFAGVAVGVIALGGLSVGWFALGGMAVGTYAIGGYAQASRIAAGGLAYGPIAIGDQTIGEVTFSIYHSVPKQAFVEAVRQRFPQVGRAVLELFYAIFPK